jgi:hypothetical protein
MSALFLLRTAYFFVFGTLLTLNARADNLTPEQREQAAKGFGMTLAQFDTFETQAVELQRAIEMVLKAPENASKFQATLKKAIANINTASKPVTTNGDNLPASFTDLVFSNQKVNPYSQSEQAMVTVLNTGFMGLATDNRIDQTVLMFAGLLLNTAPEILMPELQERAKVFPPTAADYIFYECVIDGIEENNYEMVGSRGNATFPSDAPQLPLTGSAGLLTLAHAKNPIYRLLAAQAAYRGVEPDEAKRLKFYSSYLNETDPYILGFVIKAIAWDKSPIAASVLETFEPAVQKTEDAKLISFFQEQTPRLKK